MKTVTDPLLLFAILILGIWAVAALVFEGPGWVHGLFTAGLFLLIYRIVAIGTSERRGNR